MGGALPPEYGRPDAMPALRYLRLGGNRFNGSLPDAWGGNGSWPSLRSL
jgi:hypothetical protein